MEPIEPIDLNTPLKKVTQQIHTAPGSIDRCTAANLGGATRNM